MEFIKFSWHVFGWAIGGAIIGFCVGAYVGGMTEVTPE